MKNDKSINEKMIVHNNLCMRTVNLLLKYCEFAIYLINIVPPMKIQNCTALGWSF